MRVLISGGGTGGHVYPALAVVAQLRANSKQEQDASHPLLWIGSNDGMEQTLIERAGIPFQGIDTGQLRGINPLTALINASKMLKGVQQSLQILRSFRPDVCFVTGGYVCAPVVVACRLSRVPVLIYLPDLMPGWAIRVLSWLAQRVAVSFPEAVRYFGGQVPQGKAVVTGYPVREELLASTGRGQLDAAAHEQNRVQMRQQLAERLQSALNQPGADGQPLPLVLVWGGSQGARSINRAIWAALPQLLPYAQILHVVGERDWPLWQTTEATQPLAPDMRDHYHPVAYLHEEMALALAAADISVARAGASSLGEFPIARLPAILAPLLGVNQEANAALLEKHGAALVIADEALSSQLAPMLLGLIEDKAERQSMQSALAQLAQPAAALNIARELLDLSRQAS